MKTAIITGVAGQDGAYLSKLLLERGYKVYGWCRRNASLKNLEYLGVADKISIVRIDICDPHHVSDEIYKAKPDEIYNLAAQSHVGQSFSSAMQTCQVNYGGYLNILLAARKFFPKCKIYQAGTSEMFGYSADTICNEQTPFAPMSPYAISKVAAHWAGVNARFEANQFVCNGILFNHESPIRGEDFVTRKVTKFVAEWDRTRDGVLKLGNLDSVRDWGFAGEYVQAMWAMLQQDHPDDYLISTGYAISIRNMVAAAFEEIGEIVVFEGKGVDEAGYVNGKRVVEVDPEFYRPNDLRFLKGNSAKARTRLKWAPIVFAERLIREMVREDIKRL